jgi:hypothetical protein
MGRAARDLQQPTERTVELHDQENGGRHGKRRASQGDDDRRVGLHEQAEAGKYGGAADEHHDQDGRRQGPSRPGTRRQLPNRHEPLGMTGSGSDSEATIWRGRVRFDRVSGHRFGTNRAITNVA